MNTAQADAANCPRLWLDRLTRRMLDEGNLSALIARGQISGLSFCSMSFADALASDSHYDQAIRDKAQVGATGEQLFMQVALDDVRRAADLFAPLHRQTDHREGWVSMVLSPLLADDTASLLKIARQTHLQANRPNVLIKIPGTAAGLPAIEEALVAGVPVDVTLLYSPEQFLAAGDAYLRALERRLEAGLDARVESVASLSVGCGTGGAMDRIPVSLRQRLSIALGQHSYRTYRELLLSKRWKKLAAVGARPQRLLWVSARSGESEFSTHRFSSSAMAPETIAAMRESALHAHSARLATKTPMRSADLDAAERMLARFAAAGIDINALSGQLQQEGGQALTASWKQLLKAMTDKTGASKESATALA